MSKPSRRTSAGRKRQPVEAGTTETPRAETPSARSRYRGYRRSGSRCARVGDLRLQLETGVLASDPLACRVARRGRRRFRPPNSPAGTPDCSARRRRAWPRWRRAPPAPRSCAPPHCPVAGSLRCRSWRMLLHQRSQRRFCGRIRRAVINVDDLVGPPAVERADDFRNQRRDVLRFVAHRHNDGNGDRICVGRCQIGTRLVGLGEPGTGRIGPSVGVRFYGAKAPRATLLRRPDEGPTRDAMLPSRWIANPSRRAANQ